MVFNEASCWAYPRRSESSKPGAVFNPLDLVAE